LAALKTQEKTAEIMVDFHNRLPFRVATRCINIIGDWGDLFCGSFALYRMKNSPSINQMSVLEAPMCFNAWDIIGNRWI
jgi:hypothetical protein